MTTESQCPNCGSLLPRDVPPGLCARCLLETAAPTLTENSGGGSMPRSAPRPLPGQDYGGYRILRLLGKGGMGEVWEAEQRESGRRVALKVMHHALVSEDDRKRFLREGRLAASVSHPHVVYVFGSEEIEGSPAIAMELANDGTLKDLVSRRGPLPVTEAVDHILQVMAGLESAHAAGVLHRDIKPGNCFLSEDGVVKVGDFGLSISTLAMGESMLTAAGAVCGTPSFASPEQLRGEELDVRSDIYSVGATLYFLLTGHAPIEGNDLVKLIAAVLDQAPVPPRMYRADLPKPLERILLRCLAKNPGARFGSYAELERALVRYGREAPLPASPGRRFLAGGIDELVVWAPSFVLALAGYPLIDECFLAERTLVSSLALGGLFVWSVLYCGICESVWGAGLGKRIFGIQVALPGGGTPDFRRAVARALVFQGMLLLPILAGALVYSSEQYAGQLEAEEVAMTDLLGLGALVLLFACARRRNGWAGLHDLASGTRVFAVPSTERGFALESETGVEIPAKFLDRVGPYGVVGNLAEWSDGSRLDLGYDEVLRRKIWLHRVPGSCPPVASARRDLNRATRLRWLHGRRAADDSWDAYEAPDGASFANQARNPQPWRLVRRWLSDLAEELHADPGSSVPGTNRVWMTRSGRALVLDFPAPGEMATPSAVETGLRAQQRFLSGMAM